MTGNATATTLLRRAMQADALLSGAAGLLLIALPGALGDLLGVPRPGYLLTVGLGLLGYAAWLLYSARRPAINLWAGRAAILLNILWVAASAMLLLVAPGLFNTVGQWFVGLVALTVADFAVIQYVGLRRANRGPRPAAA